MVVSGEAVLIVDFLNHKFVLHDQHILLFDDAGDLRLVYS